MRWTDTVNYELWTSNRYSTARPTGKTVKYLWQVYWRKMNSSRDNSSVFRTVNRGVGHTGSNLRGRKWFFIFTSPSRKLSVHYRYRHPLVFFGLGRYTCKFVVTLIGVVESDAAFLRHQRGSWLSIIIIVINLFSLDYGDRECEWCHFVSIHNKIALSFWVYLFTSW